MEASTENCDDQRQRTTDDDGDNGDNYDDNDNERNIGDDDGGYGDRSMTL